MKHFLWLGLCIGLSACSSIPGDTRTNLLLASETKEVLDPIMKSKNPNCDSYKIVNSVVDKDVVTTTHSSPRKRDPYDAMLSRALGLKYDPRDYHVSTKSWEETWTADACAIQWSVPIIFTKDLLRKRMYVQIDSNSVKIIQ